MSNNKIKKYIFLNGVMTLNPEYSEQEKKNNQEISLNSSLNQATTTTTSNSSSNNNNKGNNNNVVVHVTPLAIISSQNDIEIIKEIQLEQQKEQHQQEQQQQEEELPSSTLLSIQYMQTEEYRSYFHGDNNLFEELCHYFIVYEVPIGLITKLLVLKDYRLNFMVDDSGSMGSYTDVKYSETTEYISKGKRPDQFITRWEEAENRLHVIIDILAYIPTKYIQICFMNNTSRILILSQQNKTPKMFQYEYHELISTTFKSLRLGGTPTLATLKRGFQEASLHQDPTSHYLLTDGVPSDASIQDVSNLILHRANPQKNPLTLISCTNVDNECEWMKEIEEVAPYTAEIDDYNSERAEVMHDQGPAFPYTKGLWLLSNIIAALNPDDLDALDESIPFTKYTLDELLGRNHTVEEYAYYFHHNPHSSQFRDLYESFLTIKQPARCIIPPSRRSAPPRPPPPSNDSGCKIS